MIASLCGFVFLCHFFLESCEKTSFFFAVGHNFLLFGCQKEVDSISECLIDTQRVEPACRFFFLSLSNHAHRRC